MTNSQLAAYHINAKQAYDCWRAFGHQGSLKVFRALVHCQCGVECDEATVSASVLNNRQFDRIKAKFLSWSQPGNLQAQLDAEAEPGVRARFVCDYYLDQIVAHLDSLDRASEADGARRAHPDDPDTCPRDGYLLAMARRLGKTDFLDLEAITPEAWGKVISALVYRYSQVANKKTAGRPSKKRLKRPVDTPREAAAANRQVDLFTNANPF